MSYSFQEHKRDVHRCSIALSTLDVQSGFIVHTTRPHMLLNAADYLRGIFSAYAMTVSVDGDSWHWSYRCWTAKEVL